MQICSFKLHLWKGVISNTRSWLLQASGTLTLFFEVWFLSSWFVCWLIVHCVPIFVLNMFPQLSIGSSHVPQAPNVFPNMFTIAPHFISYALSNVVFFEPTSMGQYWGLDVSMFGVNASILGSLQSLKTFLWWVNQRGSLQKEILNLECTLN